MNEKAGCLFDYVGFDVVEFSCNDFNVCTWNENKWEFLVMRLMNYVHCASDISVIIQNSSSASQEMKCRKWRPVILVDWIDIALFMFS